MLKIGTLWVGGDLPLHAAVCLASFVTQGHPVTLYAYGRIGNAPPGVVLEDAAAIVPERICAPFARLGKYAQFANYFRYRMLAARPGICWVDTDAYCLRAFAPEDHIFGWQGGDVIANGILALPPDSPVLAELLAMFEDRYFVPGWIGRRRYLFRALAALGHPVPRERYPWGSLGPLALTHYLKKSGLDRFAKPVSYFYPLHWSGIDRLFDPNADWGDMLRGAYSIHLWNEVLRRREDRHEPPAGSLLWKILRGEPINCGFEA